MKLITHIGAFWLLASSAAAQTTWAVDHDSSALSFGIEIGGAEAFGRFDGWSAEIIYDEQAPQDAQVAVTIDMTTARIDNAQAAQALLSPTWLDVSGFPEARFDGSGFASIQDGDLKMDGDLALKGVTMLVPLVGQITIDGTTASARFEATLTRSEFGVGDANPAIAPTVNIVATVNALKIDY
ncbi:YceI family protein [Yoonia sp. BS5-3]|uniref:YceI family protein n=1 Tax=Yoonia phaeophyticola TaxID=3137369 RepID=A0ABZ2V879_9RHOB